MIAVQVKNLVRVCLPAFLLSIVGVVTYPSFTIFLVNIIGNENNGAFSVQRQDASQYVQNILTVSGLMFSILVGYAYYFMYQQQERARRDNSSNGDGFFHFYLANSSPSHPPFVFSTCPTIQRFFAFITTHCTIFIPYLRKYRKRNPTSQNKLLLYVLVVTYIQRYYHVFHPM